MVISTAWAVQAIVQTTLFMAISALLVRGLIGVSRCVSAKTQRTLWFLVLVQGLIIVPLPLDVPWYAPPSQPLAMTDLSPTPVRDLADDPPHARSGPPLVPGSSNSLARSETSELPAAEARPLLAPHGIASKLTGIWQWALMFWGLGMSLCVGKGLWRYVRFVRRLQVVESPDATWAAQWQQLLASHGVDRRIPFLVTRDIGPALVRLPWGYQVIVPEAAWARLTASQRQSILRHELAHYQQGDLWRLLAIRLLALPHWFNPASWWAVRKFEECTEWLCDRAAVNDPTPGTSTTEYARALLQLGSMRFPQTSWVGAAQGSRLFHRVHRLLSNHFMEDSQMKKVVLVSVAVGLLLVGNIRIRLVAKEPSATGTMAERKPAAETKSAAAVAPREHVENLPDKTAEKPARPLADLSAFPDEPAAHAMFNQMIETLQKADSLSYRSRLTVVDTGGSNGASCFRVWLKKPNYCRIEAESKLDDPKWIEFLRDRGSQSVLVGDGKTFWIYWPKGRPHFDCEYADIYDKTCFDSYVKNSATSGKFSIWKMVGRMGFGHPCFDLSIFHGHKTQLPLIFDAARSRGTERVGGEDCDRIEIVSFDDARWTFWLSKSDHLPRKVEYLFHVDWRKNAYDQVHTEEWSDVTLNADMPNKLFAWQPPQGWTEWNPYNRSEEMLKAGTMAPDFKLTSADGNRIQLSDYRGRPVWLCFWATRSGPDSTSDARYDLQRIEKIYLRYKDSGLIVLGYNATDDAKTARETMRAFGVSFPMILDASDEARTIRSQGYKVSGHIAEDYIIDRMGKIIAVFHDRSFDEDDEPILAKADSLLQKVGGEVGELAKRRVLASGSAEEVSAAAQRLFQAIREADYGRDWSKPNDRRQFPAKDASYGFRLAPKSWVTWVCNKFKTNPIVVVQLGKPFTDSEGRPTVHYRLTLKDGEILEGDLSFIRTRSLRGESWAGVEGLDWQLKKDLEKKP